MITIEGTVHHGNGHTSRFLINPEDTSWTQWGGPVELLGNSRDYIDAMAHGLHEGSDYYRQEAVLDEDTDEDTAVEGVVLDAPEADQDPEPEQETVWRGPGSVYYEVQSELANSYARHAFGVAFLDATDAQKDAALEQASLLIRTAPSLLPQEERDRLDLPATH